MIDHRAMRVIKRLKEYWKDKELAEKCGLAVKDICVHEKRNYGDGLDDLFVKFSVDDEAVRFYKCKKCGEFYR